MCTHWELWDQTCWFHWFHWSGNFYFKSKLSSWSSFPFDTFSSVVTVLWLFIKGLLSEPSMQTKGNRGNLLAIKATIRFLVLYTPLLHPQAKSSNHSPASWGVVNNFLATAITHIFESLVLGPSAHSLFSFSASLLFKEFSSLLVLFLISVYIVFLESLCVTVLGWWPSVLCYY